MGGMMAMISFPCTEIFESDMRAIIHISDFTNDTAQPPDTVNKHNYPKKL